ncbi:MAG: CpaF family protein [Steroidobacteraceae bacterium]
MSAPTVELVQRVHRELVARMDLRRADIDTLDEPALRQHTRGLLHRLIAEAALPSDVDRAALERHVLQDCIGLGLLEDLLADDSISEIMVNGPREVYVETRGRLHRHERRFSDSTALSSVIERLLGPTGRRVDEASPMVDARLRDGSRLNVVLPPLALNGPCITIRKFARQRFGLTELIACGTLNEAMARLLHTATAARLNIVISGGTATGKTTLLNALAQLIPPQERLITIEDAAELALDRDNLVALEARPRNVEGAGQVGIRDLLRNALRMRPDRIVIGECRGGEALDMLQAMNTGHTGSLTSVHANSSRDALSRLEVMALMGGVDLPLAAIRGQIASAVNLIVQIERFACGSRRIVEITEVTGTEQGTLQTQELFRFLPCGRDDKGCVAGEFEASSLPANFLRKKLAW